MSSNLLEGLNAEQKAAVTLPRQSALILAGAGSGKTRVLTTRMAWLIQNGQVGPQGLLAVTFTNKAAREMLARLSALLPINTRGMWVGTFHGLCNRLLRTHAREARLPALFQILDSQDQLSAVKRVIRALNYDEERYVPRQVQQFINSHKEEGRRPAAIEAFDAHSRALRDLYVAYEAQCQKEGVVDFAELLLRSVELLQGNELIRDHYRERFPFVLVDEFQDTNRLQYLWLRLLAGPRTAVFAVGDDDQSIYAFRGAEVENMREFERDYGITQVIRLEQNYRSFGNILDAANALIRHNSGRMGKNLWTDAGPGEPIRIYEAGSDGDEARFVVEEVKALHGEGIPLSHMALLYRSNAQSRVLEHALFSAGIGYRVYGGLRFFERMEVKHALAYLRLAANPDDDGAFLRVVNFPPRGIGARSMEVLQGQAEAARISLHQASRQTSLTGKAGTGLNAFLLCIDRLRSAAEAVPLNELMSAVLEESGLLRHYQQERDGADRVENLEELVAAAAVFDHESDDSDLAAFLSHASLEAGDHEAAPGSDALQLMTVHAAKGLEFQVVFVCGLEEGLFPHENALSETDGLEEERRLMYVAMTRARQRLYLTRAESRMLHGQVRYGLRSRFVDEVPEGLCRWLSAQTFQGGRSDFQTQSSRPAKAVDSTPASVRPPFFMGQSVTHAKFGAGVVLKCEGGGSDARVQVNFRDAGVKWLALAYARLTPADF
ncbi:MAG: UvrD-helicase domain-containing protein [Betaproteobacteria bacterium]|nr:UvrD-helicase domain-containing protein [Betaproteobacteria bacterium]MDE2622067.1 UvrD-helicase domain-containing protein [Betaproteobacteria bacterium]